MPLDHVDERQNIIYRNESKENNMCRSINRILLILQFAPQGAAYTEHVAPFYANMPTWHRKRPLPRHCICLHIVNI